MALTDNGNDLVMPVQPLYNGGYGNGGGLFGGGDSWLGILFLIALLNGGWGSFGGFGGGMGAMMMGGGMLGYDFPWLMTGQQNINTNTNNGFRDAMINDNVTSIRDGIGNLSTQLCNCCGDMQMAVANGFAGTNLGIANSTAAIQNSLCNGFNGVNMAVNTAQNAIAAQMYNNEIANLNRSFAEQTANTQGFTNVNAGIADLRYTEATENCATRTASAQNTRDIITAITAGIQSIKDDLCADRLDAERRDNANLRQELLFARGQASQVAQNSDIINGVYNRLSQCPVRTTPVYGNQPIFTCPTNVNPCGNGGF